MANRYHIGAQVRCTGEFKDSSSVAVDPTAVIMKFKQPVSKTTTTYTYGTDAELVKSSTGVYYVDVSVTEPGTYWYEYTSTGTGQADNEAYFEARESHV